MLSLVLKLLHQPQALVLSLVPLLHLQAEPLLDAEFRYISALIRKKQAAEEIEGLIFATTMKAVHRSVGAGANAVQEDIQYLWERVSDEMRQAFKLELSVGEDGEPNWKEAHSRIGKNVASATQQALRELHLKDELARLFAQRSKIIWGFFFVSILSTSSNLNTFLSSPLRVPFCVLKSTPTINDSPSLRISRYFLKLLSNICLLYTSDAADE